MSDKQDLLTHTHYDADAASVPSMSDSEDDHLLDKTHTTIELQQHDRLLLQDEEEREDLLSKRTKLGAVQKIFSTNPHDGRVVSASRDPRHKRRQEGRIKRRRRSEDSASEGELIYEMEEGFKDTSSQTSSSSVDFDDKKWGVKHDTNVKFYNRRYGQPVLYAVIAALFCAFAYGAYHASTKFRKVETSFTLSNGTHLFAPTTLYISLDGFRADFLNRGLTPTLNELISNGVSPPWMSPSFPSVTFPNHFTLVTGLYPESHGVVGNTFWDPELAEEFHYTDPTRSMQPKWWTAEPLWVTAEKQGVRTAIHMWPGSEAHIPPIEPTYVDKFNDTEALAKKVDRILGLLDLPGDADSAIGPHLRPQLIAAYVPNIDADGHLYGPNSTEIRSTISRVDSMLADLFQGLYRRNLTEIINIVIVSDHGMATTSNDRLIQLDDMIDLDLIDHIDGWPLRGLRLKNPERDLERMYEHLKAESAKSDNFEVYTLETMPQRYHFSNNARIAPLWVLPKTGWAIVERKNFDVVQAKSNGLVYKPKGLHGYDHEHPLMRAIAIMRGPAFPHLPNSRLPVFQNVEIYNIVCDSLGIKANPNNGTLRLPLRPVGLHEGDIPDAVDPPPTESQGKEVWGLPEDADKSKIASDASFPNSTGASTIEAGKSNVSDGDIPLGTSGEATATDEEDEATSSWLDFFKGRLSSAKEWANSVLDDLKSKGWHTPEPDDPPT